MKAPVPLVALIIAAFCVPASALAGATQAETTDRAAETYRAVVSVGCAPPNGQTVAYVWHTAAVPQLEGDRIFKWLASGDFEDCLSEIARTKAGLYELLTNLGPETGEGVTRDINLETMEAWARFGVYQAVQEVATSGKRGPKVAALLGSCDDLRRKREGAAPAK